MPLFGSSQAQPRGHHSLNKQPPPCLPAACQPIEAFARHTLCRMLVQRTALLRPPYSAVGDAFALLEHRVHYLSSAVPTLHRNICSSSTHLSGGYQTL